MFDIIQVSSQWTSDLVIVLTRLIHCGMVDVQVSVCSQTAVTNYKIGGSFHLITSS